MPNLGNVIWAKLCFTIKLCKCLFSHFVIATQERQKALEEMGISIQSSGIAVEKNKFYLVNLNADPSLNELLVYYLKVGAWNLFLDNLKDIGRVQYNGRPPATFRAKC